MDQTTRAARLNDYIKRVVDEAPPLTREQRDKLGVILHPRTLADLPAPDEATARTLVAKLSGDRDHFEVSQPERPEIKR